MGTSRKCARDFRSPWSEVANGCFFPVVHLVRHMLAHRVDSSSDLSLRVASDLAFPDFWHCGNGGLGADQRCLPAAGTVASRPTRHLMPCSLAYGEH